jgi:Domain of unknown function (DUF5134)
MTPAWILDLLAGLMLLVAAVSAARLVPARPRQPRAVVVDTDVAHLLMAIAMAGMLSARFASLPETAWEVVFGLMTAWFAARVVLDARANGVRALAGGHCAPHLVHSAAMLYMFLALAAPAAGINEVSGMSAASAMSGLSDGSGSMMMTLAHPAFAFVFALILVGYSVWDLDQLSGRRYSRAATPAALAGAGGQAVTATAAEEPGAAPLAASPAGDWLLSPAVTIGCRIVMGVTMVFTLIIAI